MITNRINFKNSNLILVGFKTDHNGNRKVVVCYPNRATFSISTTYLKVPNIISVDDLYDLEKNLIDYIEKNGTRTQKLRLTKYD